jgi:type II secretory pathway component PulJ
MPTAPRWFLLIVLGAAGSVLAFAGSRWVDYVETHIRESGQGYQRIAGLEARVQTLEAHAAWCRSQHKAEGR